jgi:prostaglandin-endoperoxide synthase 2
MGSVIEDVLLPIGSFLLGKDKINEILISRLVNKGRTRPHPWSTRCEHICWSGMTDRTFNARLLPPKHHSGPEGPGTARPPIDQVALLFAADPAGQRPCPKSTCLFPAFAQYLTDGFIRTQLANKPPFGDDNTDRKRTTSNHDIDLSPLYGRNAAQTGVLRLQSETPGKKGRLKSQIINGEEYSPFLFSSLNVVDPQFCLDGKPVLDFPLGVKNSPPPAQATLFAVGGDRVNAVPQVAMINILLLREHNRLAAMLDAANAGWDDDAVFQTARNILIAMFIKVVVEEYINHINTAKFKVMAKPEVAWKADWYRTNWMTAEFSLLYRWHSLVPSTIKWSGHDIPVGALLLDNSRLIAAGLASAFAEISANNATELGLGNSAAIFVGPPVDAEPRAVEQGRINEIDSYNAYRKAMKRDPATSFEDVVGVAKTKNPVEKARRVALAARLKGLYGSVDNLEFYVGLFAEPREENGPLPALITSMVAMDAFSQAFTNPLLSEHVWGDKTNAKATFTDAGIALIAGTSSLRDILARNTTDLNDRFVGMTRRDWKRE